MKKTISLAALAISASSSFALIGPPSNNDVRMYCVSVYGGQGSMVAGSCDETDNNRYYHREIMDNGCAEGQMAIYTSKSRRQMRYPIEINMCLPPNVAQL